MSDSQDIQKARIGHGYDLHRLEPRPPDGNGRVLILAGVKFEDHPFGPVSHSDGDVILHAVTDAILGAIGEPDIGQLFPDNDLRNESVNSSVFVKEAVNRMESKGMTIGNIDITVICQQPKVGPVKDKMIAQVSELLKCNESQVNLKGKTHEGVDAVGEGRAIETHAVVLLVKV